MCPEDRSVLLVVPPPKECCTEKVQRTLYLVQRCKKQQGLFSLGEKKVMEKVYAIRCGLDWEAERTYTKYSVI